MKRANHFSLFKAFLVVGLVAGCYSRDEKPRGTGASGKGLSVLSAPMLDIEKFFQYGPEHEKVLSLLHRPFHEVVKKTEAANATKAKEALTTLERSWDQHKFALPKQGVRYKYRTTITTTHGDLVIDFFEGFAPDLVRNYMNRLTAGLVNGTPFVLDGDAISLGPPVDQQAYTLPARPIPTPRPRGAVFAYLVGDRAAGERVGISLKHIPGGGAHVTIIGLVANPSFDRLLNEFESALKKKPGSIVVKHAKIEPFEHPIFKGSDVALPTLTKAGELQDPDLPMYTQVSGSQIFGESADKKKGGPPSDGKKDSLLDAPLIPSTIENNPNAPTPSPDKKGAPKPP
jgi:hypothetical protein